MSRALVRSPSGDCAGGGRRLLPCGISTSSHIGGGDGSGKRSQVLATRKGRGSVIFASEMVVACFTVGVWGLARTRT